MRYNDIRDDVIAEIAAVIAKYGGTIKESEMDNDCIVSLPPTERARNMGCCGIFFHMQEVADKLETK